jgi:poly(A) polymerase
VLDGWKARREGLTIGRQKFDKTPIFPALADSVDAAFEERIGDVSGRGKLGADMREIWMMQPRFEKRVGGSPFTLVEHLRFRAGFDFLCLRSRSDSEEGLDYLKELAQWWEEFQFADHPARLAMIEEVKAKPKTLGAPAAAKSRPKRKRKPRTKSDTSSTAGDMA